MHCFSMNQSLNWGSQGFADTLPSSFSFRESAPGMFNFKTVFPPQVLAWMYVLTPHGLLGETSSMMMSPDQLGRLRNCFRGSPSFGLIGTANSVESISIIIVSPDRMWRHSTYCFVIVGVSDPLLFFFGLQPLPQIRVKLRIWHVRRICTRPYVTVRVRMCVCPNVYLYMCICVRLLNRSSSNACTDSRSWNIHRDIWLAYLDIARGLVSCPGFVICSLHVICIYGRIRPAYWSCDAMHCQ